jgi:hypothetical protein
LRATLAQNLADIIQTSFDHPKGFPEANDPASLSQNRASGIVTSDPHTISNRAMIRQVYRKIVFLLKDDISTLN